MNKLRFLFNSFLLVICFNTSAQVSEVWKESINGSIQWQQVNSFGNFMVGTSNELIALNPETGKVIWSNKDYANISENQIEQQSGSPFMVINQNSLITIIDPFSGEVKFNSNTAGIKTILTKEVLYKSNGIFIAGNDSKENPVILMIDIASGKTIWKLEEKFGKIITIFEISKEELLIVTLFNVYKISSLNGSVIWKSATSKEAEQMSGSALSGLMQSFADKALADAELKLEFYKHPTKNICVIGAESKSQSQGTGGSTINEGHHRRRCPNQNGSVDRLHAAEEGLRPFAPGAIG